MRVTSMTTLDDLKNELKDKETLLSQLKEYVEQKKKEYEETLNDLRSKLASIDEDDPECDLKIVKMQDMLRDTIGKYDELMLGSSYREKKWLEEEIERLSHLYRGN